MANSISSNNKTVSCVQIKLGKEPEEEKMDRLNDLERL